MSEALISIILHNFALIVKLVINYNIINNGHIRTPGVAFHLTLLNDPKISSFTVSSDRLAIGNSCPNRPVPRVEGADSE